MARIRVVLLLLAGVAILLFTIGIRGGYILLQPVGKTSQVTQDREAYQRALELHPSDPDILVKLDNIIRAEGQS